eukprot:scaffold12278_cov52-Attheya_sp.AAC.1
MICWQSPLLLLKVCYRRSARAHRRHESDVIGISRWNQGGTRGGIKLQANTWYQYVRRIQNLARMNLNFLYSYPFEVTAAMAAENNKAQGYHGCHGSGSSKTQ